MMVGDTNKRAGVFRYSAALPILALVIFATKELVVPIEYSSRAVIENMVLNGGVGDNYPIFGNALDGVQYVLENYLRLDRSYYVKYMLHVAYLTSGLCWTLLLVIWVRATSENNKYAAYLVMLYINPVFINFDTLAWRQSLSLAIAIIGMSFRNRPIVLLSAIVIAIIIHPGILPVATSYIIFTVLTAQYILYCVAGCLLLSQLAYLAFPINQSILPGWVPFRNQLTMIPYFVATNPEFNNINGSIVARYLAIGVVPLVAATALSGSAANAEDIKHDAVAVVAMSIPIAALNYVPGANRLLYYAFVGIALFSPRIVEHLAAPLLAAVGERRPAAARWVAFVVLVAFHIVVAWGMH